jgi:proliferating cell nuclear antigen
VVKVRMEDSKIWKSSIGAIANLIDEGVTMKAMDPSHVALIDFELPAKAFAEYDVKEETILGVDLTEMNKIMSRAKPDDGVALELDKEKNRLALTFKGKSTRRFSLPLIDISEVELPEPKLEFTASAEVSAGAIQDGLKDAGLVGDNVRFEVSEKEFYMSSESDSGSAEMKLLEGDEGLKKLDVKQPAKAASSDDVITINLGTDLPILLNFQMADGKGRLKFLLAPRIEAE